MSDSRTYRPRKLRFHGRLEDRGWSLKIYSVAQHDLEIAADRFGDWRSTALATLPQPARDSLRPGLGFIILHQAAVSDYLVVCWWDNGNELPLRVFVSSRGTGWRPAGERDSFCVWDLEIVAFERQAFIDTMMRDEPDEDKWRALHIGEAASLPPALGLPNARAAPAAPAT